MRRIPLLTAALLAPAVPVLAATSAYAADNVICVNIVDLSCADDQATIAAAITAANSHAGADVIWIGPGEHFGGPYQLNGSTQDLTLKGSGPATVLTFPAGGAQEFVWANHATVRDLTITMETTNSSNDKAIRAFGGSVIENVTVDGTGTSDATAVHATASQVTGSSLMMPLTSGSRGMYVDGGATVTDTTIAGETAVNHSGTGVPDTLSRTTLRAGSYAGLLIDSGTVDIDNSVIDLGSTGGTGMRAENGNGASTMEINADHVTIIGGNGSSEGVWALANVSGAQQTSTITLTNSIVRGPAKPLVAWASNNGAPGVDSNATVAVSHTDFAPGAIDEQIGANGAGGVIAGVGNLDVDPAFVDQAGGDYHLSPGSPVIDKGEAVPGPGQLDRDGTKRVVDGDANGTAVRDLGAFEFPDTIAPVTTITSGPSGSTRDTTPTFGFTGGADASYECQVDAAAYAACAGPFTTAALANGTHTFRVRATDAAGNVDATPAARSFRVDTVAPQTTFTRKPAKVITKRRVTFAFVSSEVGSRFACRLDKGAWRSCVSPKVVRVKKGRHAFLVRAIDAAGNADLTPALYRFRRA